MPFYRGMTCENVTINGDKGTPITAYVAKPSGSGPFPGVVLVHHLPGWSEFSTSARVEAATATLTTSPPRCAPRAALPTPRWSAIPRPQ